MAVQDVCVGTGMGFDPAFYAYRPTHPMAAHGYGPVIWAGAEMLRLLRQQHPMGAYVLEDRLNIRSGHIVTAFQIRLRLGHTIQEQRAAGADPHLNIGMAAGRDRQAGDIIQDGILCCHLLNLLLHPQERFPLQHALHLIQGLNALPFPQQGHLGVIIRRAQ